MAERPEPLQLDITANRAARKYTRREQALRVLWALGRVLFRFSPRPCFAWRRLVLRVFGAQVASTARIHATAIVCMPWNVVLEDWSAVGEDVFIYSLGKVRLGRNATLSYRSHVCAGTHDFNDPTLPLLKPPIVIEDNAWIGTEAFIGPGVTVGNGAIIGARTVVVKDVPPMNIVAGNPARPVGMRTPTRQLP